MHHHTAKHDRHFRATVFFVVLVLIVSGIALLAALQTGDDDGMPRCPASRTGSVDLVPSGARPCVLYGADSVPAALPGTRKRPAVRPGVKAPAEPKAVRPKAPAAPRR
ncbi:hypothetical protein SAM9427_37010 (plasmid) [Streptomyces sp. ETH9427]|uniref:hypothetical protein n=1 Tax=Streptomyces sp. E1N211 TaxID=1851876 RepID=UPI000E0B064C|nr:hypothetical protein [Streptomyces sp. E1N211]AXI91369.1 hypothetical protein SAM9427_37010 [Streptomyces sp. ETH9427]